MAASYLSRKHDLLFELNTIADPLNGNNEAEHCALLNCKLFLKRYKNATNIFLMIRKENGY